MTEPNRLRAKDVLPDLCAEIERDLRGQGDHHIANTVDFLRIYGLCPCTDDFCGSFYTAPRPNGKYGPGHRTMLLDSSPGMVILDVVDGIITFVELIDRPEVKPYFDHTACFRSSDQRRPSSHCLSGTAQPSRESHDEVVLGVVRCIAELAV